MKLTQLEIKEKRSRSKIKKALFILLKIITVLVMLLVLFVVIVYTVNKISSNAEQKRMEPYGQHVSVDGKLMNISVQGEGEETIVLLPGFGNPSPYHDFKPLVRELTPYYRVVVVEPFGYGLSDQTDKERSTANIVSEIHEALQSLQIDRYILMGHSISGIYSLDYVNQYPDEVSAFVGLDSSVPALSEQKIDSSMTAPVKWFRNLGFARLQIKLEADPYDGLAYDEKTKEQLSILIRKNRFNNTQLNEAESMFDNFLTAQTQALPADLPVLLFVQANHPATDQWVPEHEKQIKDSANAELVLVEGDHYLYRTHSKEIAESFRGFMAELGNGAAFIDSAAGNH
ncbi:alpha/beta hydrolase [Paenibacillus oryzae]|uniref:Alpha/beta hydrolase n=1 Tax=Paenibacillus oryzae TaxID=1844972 RepID=A0A1A5YLP2_9BACL|nr:alpha/beta hydrolase [Paenibacillus oryzae]OBR66524.1 alpha/beta hydrolase [Paenibacillus oryzae]